MRLSFSTPCPPGLDVALHDLAVCDDEPAAWQAALLGDPAPLSTETLNEQGWPMTLAHAVVREPDGSIRAHRVGAFYRFFHFTAAVVVTFDDLATLTARLPAMVAWCQSGCPDLRGTTVLALDELH